MNDAKFWEIVKTVNWAKDCNYKRIKHWMLNNLTLEEAMAFRKIASQKWALLDNLVGERNPANGGDDSHSDLLYHVVGLGKKEFEAHLDDFLLLAARGSSYGSEEGYTESFSYAIPYEDDYEKSNDPAQLDN